eukprot:TRINITY_DN945_c0_g1_i1.p1 TRINITY_DN945_c0_g1~~TRINITY_DN945_c0_g1_i1.p1  ORF type:complete len:1221 (+),score=475.85 TRINITY_DN945_c0_g1_i1:429-4091(+)
MGGRHQGAPQQYRQQRHEDDHFLVVAGPEGAEGFQQPHQQRAACGRRETGQRTDGGGDEALEADQEAGVIKDGAHRADQHARQSTDKRCHGKGQLARQRRGDTHQPRPQAVHRRGAQGLAIQGAAGEQPQRHQQRHGGHHHHHGLRAQGELRQVPALIPEGRRAESFCTEEHQAQPGHGQVDADRDDQQLQHAGIGHRFIDDLVHQRPQCGDEQQREQHLHRQRELQRRGPPHQGRDGQRRAQRAGQCARQQCRLAAAQQASGLHAGRADGQHQQQPQRAGTLTLLQHGQRQGTEGDELALRDEEDAGDREDQHQCNGDQAIDDAVGQAIQGQDGGNRRVHESQAVEGSDKAANGPAADPGRPDRRQRSLRSDGLPVAVLDGQHDAGVVTQAEVILGRVVQRALRDMDRAGIFQRVLERRAEGRGAGLGLLERFRHYLLQHQLRVVDVGGEEVAGAGAILLLVAGHEVGRQLFGGIAVRQCLRHHGRARHHVGTLDILAAQADQVARGGAVGLEDPALVAAFDEGLVRHCRATARGHHQHRIRVAADHAQGLRGDAGVGPREALHRADLDAGGTRQALHLLEPVLTIGVGVTQETDVLHAQLLHLLHHATGHHGGGLRQAEGPGVAAFGSLDGRDGQLHRLRLQRHVGHGQRRRHGSRADDQVDLVLGHQAARILAGLGGIGGVVEDDQLDLLAADALGPQCKSILGRDAQARTRAGQRHHHADGQLGVRCARTGQHGRQYACLECQCHLHLRLLVLIVVDLLRMRLGATSRLLPVQLALHIALMSSGMAMALMRFGSSGWRIANTRVSRPSQSSSPSRFNSWRITKVLSFHSMMVECTSSWSPQVAGRTKRELMSTTGVPMMPRVFSVSRQGGTPHWWKKLREAASYQRKKLGKYTMPAGSQSPNSTRTGQRMVLSMSLSLARRQPQCTIQADHLAVEREVGGDVQGQLRIFLGLAQALGEGDGGGQRLLHFFGQLVEQRGQEQARSDGHHADAVLRQVARQRQCHGGDATLGGGIAGLPDLAIEGRHRGGGHDHAALAFGQWFGVGHAGGHQADHVEGADQVDVDDAAEVVQRDGAAILAHHAAGAADAGAVDQDARHAIGCLGGLQGRFHGGGVGDVAAGGVAFQFIGQCLGGIHVDVQDGNTGAGPYQLAYGFGTEAGGAAGDQRGLSLQLHEGIPCRFSGRPRGFPAAGQCPGHRRCRPRRCCSAHRAGSSRARR